MKHSIHTYKKFPNNKKKKQVGNLIILFLEMTPVLIFLEQNHQYNFKDFRL